MRDPALYVKLSDLTALLEDITGNDSKDLAIKLLKQANVKGLQIKGRIPPVATATERKKVTKLLAKAEVSTADVELFQRILNMKRQELKHSTITQIDPTHKDWNQLKTVVELAFQFSEAFGYTTHKGFEKFVDEGLKRMKRTYRLSLFVYHAQAISDAEAAKRTVTQDTDKEATGKFYRAWESLYIEYAGGKLYISDKDYINYQHFVYGRLTADEHKADYREWLKAQFEGLQFTSKVPDLAQLYTDNALERYNSYRITMKKEQDPVKGILKNILDRI